VFHVRKLTPQVIVIDDIFPVSGDLEDSAYVSLEEELGKEKNPGMTVFARYRTENAPCGIVEDERVHVHQTKAL
jgi:hypothetical protein